MSDSTERAESVALVVFGGSFDPPHAGHVESAKAALARFPEARLVVTPAPAPAGAAGAHKHPTAPFQARLELCRRAFASLDGKVEVSDIEATLPRPNYTVTTLKAFKSRFLKTALGFLMGQDQWESLPRWKEPDEIARLARLIVVPRAGTKDLRGESAERWPAVLLPERVSDANSTKIREDLRTGNKLPDGWLPSAVDEYIREHHLYGT